MSRAGRRPRERAGLWSAPGARAGGHANLTTTMKYMHLSPGAKDAAIRLLDQRPTTDESGGDVGETTKPARAGSSVLQ